MTCIVKTYVVSQKNNNCILPTDESVSLVGFRAKPPYHMCTNEGGGWLGRRVSAAGTRSSQELLDERKWAEGINKERRRVMNDLHQTGGGSQLSRVNTRIYSCEVWIRMKFCSFDDKMELRYWRWHVGVNSLVLFLHRRSCSMYTLMN